MHDVGWLIVATPWRMACNSVTLHLIMVDGIANENCGC